MTGGDLQVLIGEKGVVPIMAVALLVVLIVERGVAQIMAARLVTAAQVTTKGGIEVALNMPGVLAAVLTEKKGLLLTVAVVLAGAPLKENVLAPRMVMIVAPVHMAKKGLSMGVGLVHTTEKEPVLKMAEGVDTVHMKEKEPALKMVMALVLVLRGNVEIALMATGLKAP